MELLDRVYKELDKERKSPFLADLNWEMLDKAKKIQPSKRPEGMSEALVDILLLRLNKVLAIQRYCGGVPQCREEYDYIVEKIKKANAPFLIIEDIK
jgi:hypothetical protein